MFRNNVKDMFCMYDKGCEERNSNNTNILLHKEFSTGKSYINGIRTVHVNM